MKNALATLTNNFKRLLNSSHAAHLPAYFGSNNLAQKSSSATNTRTIFNPNIHQSPEQLMEKAEINYYARTLISHLNINSPQQFDQETSRMSLIYKGHKENIIKPQILDLYGDKLTLYALTHHDANLLYALSNAGYKLDQWHDRENHDILHHVASWKIPNIDQLITHLVKHNINVNAATKKGSWPPLNVAACAGNYQAARALIDNGAIINNPHCSVTALQSVMLVFDPKDENANDYLETMNVLLQNGAQTMLCKRDEYLYPRLKAALAIDHIYQQNNNRSSFCDIKPELFRALMPRLTHHFKQMGIPKQFHSDSFNASDFSYLPDEHRLILTDYITKTLHQHPEINHSERILRERQCKGTDLAGRCV